MLGTPPNSCFFSKCSKFPINMCQCTPEVTYSCSKHIAKHLKLVKVTHKIKDVTVSILEGSDKVQFLKKIEKLILEINRARQMTLNAGNEISVNLNQNIKKFLLKIETVKLSMINAKQLILSNKQINNEFIENLKEAKTLNTTVEYKTVIEKIPEITTLEVKYKDKCILHSEHNDPNLYTIDLDSLKKNVVANFSKYWNCSAACKIGKNEYFCTGGYSKSYISYPYYHGNTSIVNIKKGTQTILDPDTSRCHHCCIFKENQVYVFGGYTTSAISSATKFDMRTKGWSALPNLPKAAYILYSALINNKIIITSYAFAGVYVFDNNNYVMNLNLDGNYYIACDKWIAGNNSLYECINLEKVEWDKHAIPFSANYGSFNITYKRHKFIYWINYLGQLWRIDTEKKSAEQVQFS